MTELWYWPIVVRELWREAYAEQEPQAAPILGAQVRSQVGQEAPHGQGLQEEAQEVRGGSMEDATTGHQNDAPDEQAPEVPASPAEPSVPGEGDGGNEQAPEGDSPQGEPDPEG